MGKERAEGATCIAAKLRHNTNPTLNYATENGLIYPAVLVCGSIISFIPVGTLLKER